MDALQYLFSLEKLGIKFGLDNIRTICRALGSPQDAFRSILIAGTNGKGSVTAMVERALRASGVRTGRYTSPHLIRLEERFVIDGIDVKTAAMAAAARRVQHAIERSIEDGRLPGPPTFFEATTAVAFELFRQHEVEIAVLEVGLGGRFDATNVVTPILTAITSIDFDHQALLGSSLSAIAFEKAGIVKPGVPLVLGESRPEAVEVIAQLCRERGAPLLHAMGAVQMQTRLEETGRLAIEVTTPARRYQPVRTSLRGRHQARNAITAIRLLEQLDDGISEQAIASGVCDVTWSGRLDCVEMGPGRRVMLDAAHNPAGASALTAYLAEAHQRRLPIVFSAMHDKDAEAMLIALRSQASAFIITAPRTARARPVEELAALVRRTAPAIPAYLAPQPSAALARAWELAPTICATGSIFLIGEVLGLASTGTY